VKIEYFAGIKYGSEVAIFAPVFEEKGVSNPAIAVRKRCH